MIKKAVFITDIHYPYQHNKTIDIAKKVCKDIKPDYLIFGGDNWDAEGISKFTAKDGQAGIISTYDEMIGFKEKVFTPLIKSCNNDKLDVRLLLGNHDGQRLTDYLEKAQQKGLDDVYNYWNKQFNYKKIFNCQITDYNETCKIGNLNFIHGERHNKYHANSHFLILMANVIYGHLHTTQIYTHVNKGREPFQAIAIPGACEMNPNYMKNRASAWINGFAVVYFVDKCFWYDIIQIINGKTIFNGKLYE